MKTAIIHDYLPYYSGAERVLEQIIRIYPEADIFSIVDFIPADRRGFLLGKSVNTSFLQSIPFSRRLYRQLLPLMPFAIEQFDLHSYDLIVSSSYAVAKGVIVGPDQLHVSYVHSPMRYAWDLQHQYLRESGMERGLKSWAARSLLHYLRIWDSRTADGVDAFAANSHFVARRILKAYRRPAEVVYPPVDTEHFTVRHDKEDFFLAASRLVPYKRLDLVVRAFSRMPEHRLVVIGEGPDLAKLKRCATPNVELLGYQPFEVLRDHMQRARAFVFAAQEDFGIVLVEAQACGTPVIAFGKGGATEIVIDGHTGLLFPDQDEENLIAAVRRFERVESEFDARIIRHNAERFSSPRFRTEFKGFIDAQFQERDGGSDVKPHYPVARGERSGWDDSLGAIDRQRERLHGAVTRTDHEWKS